MLGGRYPESLIQSAAVTAHAHVRGVRHRVETRRVKRGRSIAAKLRPSGKARCAHRASSGTDRAGPITSSPVCVISRNPAALRISVRVALHVESFALPWACAASPHAVSIHACAMYPQRRYWRPEHIRSACRESSGTVSSKVSTVCTCAAPFRNAGSAKLTPGRDCRRIAESTEEKWSNLDGAGTRRRAIRSGLLAQVTIARHLPMDRNRRCGTQEEGQPIEHDRAKCSTPIRRETPRFERR